MAGLIDIEYMRGAFRIHTDVADERITPYLAPAARRLKKWVGADTYATADEDDAAVLKTAEGLVAMHYMVLNLNTSIRPEGLVRTERDEGSLNGGVTITFLSPTETGLYGQMYLDQAQEILGELNLLDGTPGAPVVGIACA